MQWKFLPAALLLGGMLTGASAFAQCPGCVVDPACATLAPEGGLCPEIIPAATVGQAYSENITFYIPSNATDPSTGIDVDVLQVTITNLNGLPLGLDWECNNAASGCVYTPPASPPASELGCVKLCGTALGAPGVYSITVDVIAQVVAFGITLSQPLSFDATIELLPPVSGASTFTVTGEPDCSDQYVATFSALINGSPNPTTWAWDFGNGTTSSAQNPAPVVYAPGSYNVTLTTTVFDYIITAVNLNSMNDNWCGDIEEPYLFGICTADPDPFFDIRDASSNIIYTSSTKDDVLSASWPGLNVPVPANFSIEFTDEDLVTQSDPLGTFSFALTAAGTYSFSGAGGTSGTIEVGTAVQTVYPDADAIAAFADPFVGPFAAITDATTVGGSDGALDISISGGTSPYTFFWSNGAMTEDITGLAAGDYNVLISDMDGCSIRDTFTVNEPANVPCAPEPTALTALTFSAEDVLLSWGPLAQPTLGYQLQGRRQGDLGWVNRKTVTPSLFVENLTPGESYEFRVRAKCSVTNNVSNYSTIYPFTMPTARIGAATATAMGVSLYPNPAVDRSNLTVILGQGQELAVSISDALGRVVQANTQFRAAGQHNIELDLQDLTPGFYLVTVQGEQDQKTERLVVE